MTDTNDERLRGIRITNTQGNVTIGDDNTVTNTVHVGGGPRDPRQEELLQAVRRFRTDLRAVMAPRTFLPASETVPVRVVPRNPPTVVIHGLS